jgi:hypothetical protein
MAELDKGDGRDIRLPSADRVAQARERERKLRTLRRLSEALGRPVEDFFKTGAGADATEGKVDGARGK